LYKTKTEVLVALRKAHSSGTRTGF